MGHFEEKVVAARKLVSQGKDCSEMARILGVSSSVVSMWCRDINKTKFVKLVKLNEFKRKGWLNYDEKLVKTVKSAEEARVWCGVLYGCEGAKYPASNVVSFVNSDVELMVAFVWLMRCGFELDEGKWKVLLQMHTNQDYQVLRNFWSRRLNISESQFYKPTITTANGKKHRKGYVGTCTVRYGDYRIQLRLIGIFREFLRKCGRRVGRTAMHEVANLAG